MREIDGKIGECVERKVTAEDQLRRIDIRAPPGRHSVSVRGQYTVGGVITAGEPIMMIVPEADNLAVEAETESGRDRSASTIGQQALLRIRQFQPAYDAWKSMVTLPAFRGRIFPTGPAFRRELLLHDPDRHAVRGGAERGDDVKLVPGMPVETFVQTGDRTVISLYLAKPFTDQLKRAFREK